MEPVYLLFVIFVIIGPTAPVIEAGLLDPIRNMFTPTRSRSQSRQDLHKLYSRFRDNSDTLDGIDPIEFDPNYVTTDPNYVQIQFDSYQYQGNKPVRQTLILNKNFGSLIKTTPDKPEQLVEHKKKLKEQKPPPEYPKPPPECPNPPPECPKPPPECSKPPPKCPIPPPECPKPPLESPKPPPECPKPPPECPKPLPECPKPPPKCLKLPSDESYNLKFPSDDPHDSEVPSNGPFNSNLPSDGPYNSDLPPDHLSSSKTLLDGRNYSKLPPINPNISNLPNDSVGKSRWDTDEPNIPNLDDIDITFDSNNMWPEENKEIPGTTSKKTTLANDYDNIVAQKFLDASKLLEQLRKLKELHKMSENKNNEDNYINKNVNKNDNTGNDGDNEYSKATPESSKVKSIKEFNNEDINALLQPEGVYMRITTSASVDYDRTIMRKLTKRRFYYRARPVKPEI